MEHEKNVSALDLLLRPEAPDARKALPEKQAEVTRLSETAGEPVIFTVRALSCSEIRRVQDKPREDQAVCAVLYGCKDPDFRDKRLLDPELLLLYYLFAAGNRGLRASPAGQEHENYHRKRRYDGNFLRFTRAAAGFA